MPPYTSLIATVREPGENSSMIAVVAPIPDEKQTPCLPPSSEARHSSSAVRVGLIVRA